MEVISPAHLAGRFAGLYSLRKTGYVLRSARVLGALGYSVEVVEPAHGLSLCGISDDKLFNGDVVRKLLVKMEQQADLSQPALIVPPEPRVAVKVRERASRRAVKQAVDTVEAEARALNVAEQLVSWYNQRVDVILPLKTNRLATQEARQLADMADQWEAHPSRADQTIALVHGVEYMWAEWAVPLNACVIRFWNKKKKRTDHIVLVTTDLKLSASWMVRHYEERPEIEQDYEQMQSGGWQLKKLSSTRYSEIVLYVLTVVLSYSLYHLFANTQRGLALPTRRARPLPVSSCAPAHAYYRVRRGLF
jgi:hypothetical protein